MNPRKLKRIVIKEELVALTGCYKQSIILNQLMYWSERVRDFDKLIVEEQQRDAAHDVELRHGWIYKTSEELADETMLGLSKSNMRTHIKRLVAAGWISERRNPHVKFDNTLQYRVDFVRLRKDLLVVGYDLHGYVFEALPIEPDPTPDISNRDIVSRNETTRIESKQQYQRLLDRDLKMDVCTGAREPDHTEHDSDRKALSPSSVQNPLYDPHNGTDPSILAALTEGLRYIPVTDAATLYDAYFDAIFAMLTKSFADRLDPEIIRMACEIYADKQIDQPGLLIRNPVGFFFNSYNDAILQWKAVRYREGRQGVG